MISPQTKKRSWHFAVSVMMVLCAVTLFSTSGMYQASADAGAKYGKQKERVMTQITPITWGTPFGKQQATYIPGVLQTEAGGFECVIKVGDNGSWQLMYLDMAGGAEAPKREVKLYLLRNEKKCITSIYQEVLPLANSHDAPWLRLVATVYTQDLLDGVQLASDQSR